MKKIFNLRLLLLMTALVLFACKPERLVAPTETLKDIKGNWLVIKATRNGTDLTNRFDFSKFRINFTDSTYTLDGPLPFIVSKSGKWAFDDPNYPFYLSFTATDSTAKQSSLLYPVTGGQRNIVITFSPGCTLNSYQYTLQKAN